MNNTSKIFVNLLFHSGLVNIRSNVALRLGEWHRIVITRKLKEGTLQIDQQ